MNCFGISLYPVLLSLNKKKKVLFPIPSATKQTNVQPKVQLYIQKRQINKSVRKYNLFYHILIVLAKTKAKKNFKKIENFDKKQSDRNIKMCLVGHKHSQLHAIQVFTINRNPMLAFSHVFPIH